MTQESTTVQTPITVSIDLNELINKTDFLPGSYNHEFDEYEPGAPLIAMIAHIIATKINTDVKNEVIKAVESEVKAQVGQIVRETIEGTVRVTNGFGEPTGGTMTLRERIVKEAKEALDRRVDSRTGSYDRYGHNGIPLTQFVAREAATAAIKGELSEAAKQAVAEVKKSVTELVTHEIGQRVVTAVTTGIK